VAHRIRNHGKLCLGNQPILVLTRYFVYDHQARARLALDKAAPDGRPTEQPEHGPVIPIPKSAACTIAPSGARAEPASLVRRCPDLPSFRPLAILQPTLPLFPWTRGPPTANGSASHDPCLSVACLRDGASDTSGSVLPRRCRAARSGRFSSITGETRYRSRWPSPRSCRCRMRAGHDDHCPVGCADGEREFAEFVGPRLVRDE